MLHLILKYRFNHWPAGMNAPDSQIAADARHPSDPTVAETEALDAMRPDHIARDVARLVRTASPTGSERAAMVELAAIAADLGLETRIAEYDLAALREDPDYPGEEAARDELVGLTVTLPGRSGAPRLCLNGHLDVVAPGSEPWRHAPFAGTVVDDRIYGCGALDMKGGVIAALHAMAAVKGSGGPAGGIEIVLQAVSSEEDGGLGTFAALRQDARFDACLIPEPSGFDVVVAHGGALTFTGTIRGSSAHAAVRLQGRSAIDRYIPVHQAIAEHERTLNADVAHPLMAQLELPYPILVGRVLAGQWSSQVPDELSFEGRLGVAVGADLATSRVAFEQAVAAAVDGEVPPVEIRWTGGQFAPAQTDTEDPFVALVREAAVRECKPDASLCGVPYGADMRLFCAHGIPTVMLGTPGLERAHAADEWVSTEDLVRLSRAIVLILSRFGDESTARSTPPR